MSAPDEREPYDRTESCDAVITLGAAFFLQLAPVLGSLTAHDVGTLALVFLADPVHVGREAAGRGRRLVTEPSTLLSASPVYRGAASIRPRVLLRP